MYIKINQLQGASYMPLDTVKFFGEDFVLPDTTLLITDRGDIYRVPADTVGLVRGPYHYETEALKPMSGTADAYLLPEGLKCLESLNGKKFWIRRKDIAYVGDTTGKTQVGLTDGRTYKVVTPVNEILEF